jgi:hypothetical protein
MNTVKTVAIIALIISKIELYAADYSQVALAVNESMAMLSSERPYAYFELGLSDKERDLFQNLNIALAQEYVSYGIEKNFEQELIEFINKIGSFYDDNGIVREYQTSLNKDIAHAAAQCITKIILDVLRGSKQETALIKVRSFLPTHEFDMARWHIDKSRQASTHRFTIALKGHGTLFYDISADTKEKFFAIQGREKNMSELRKKLAALLEDETHISKPPASQGAVFMVNSKDGAVHSEPVINEIRLLLAITPHSKAAFDTMLENERQENEKRGIDSSELNQKINF